MCFVNELQLQYTGCREGVGPVIICDSSAMSRVPGLSVICATGFAKDFAGVLGPRASKFEVRQASGRE